MNKIKISGKFYDIPEGTSGAERYHGSWIDRDGEYHQLYWGESEN